jgi:3'(2'), 5'-bisphosphate nucleotidase
MVEMKHNINLLDVTNAAYKAGKKILEVYDTDFTVETKEDDSPLTLADRKSHETIIDVLATKYGDIPILSEEGKHLPFEERKGWPSLWVVDPLDGTKEFVKRNGEFTVNIALVEGQAPVIGIIYVPVKDIMYFSKEGLGAFKILQYSEKRFSDETGLINNSEKVSVGKPEIFTVVASRSHMSPETKDFIEQLEQTNGKAEIISAGSSLKLCLVAEGQANVYPRFAPTMEWDTAAGHAIVEAAGGKVVDTEKRVSLQYNKENLLNPWFIVKNKENY